MPYVDDDPFEEDGSTVRDGCSIRTSMLLADARPRETPMFFYGRGYMQDANRRSPTAAGTGNTAPAKSSEPVQQPWPTAHSGTFPSWNHTVGEACVCANGQKGRLVRSPDNSSVLVCQPDDADDAATVDGTSAYYAMKDAMQDEWRRYGPRPLHDCGCSGRAHDQEGTVGFVPPAQLPWMTSGQSEGQECSVNGAPGRLARVDGKLVCRPVENSDAASVAQARRDAAWRQSVIDAENAWRQVP
jgi:hypothetical protein